ncbi:hypothetical protein [Candidatus Microthrix parvicella]|uniref:hypothetical protein n=1 Tax=Candidatus Neomicrothrix parvicella TaxID=41950 RepID=UPI000377FA4A|nr:hypothetical protein [Candidatus Microthrix parvicella]
MTDPRYELAPSALRHHIDIDDTLHAINNALYEFHLDAEPPRRPHNRILVIGPDRSGSLLEIVHIPTDTAYRVIHSMRLRPGTRAKYL